MTEVIVSQSTAVVEVTSTTSAVIESSGAASATIEVVAGNSLPVIDAVSFSFSQPTPAITWTVNHNLGFRPNLTVFDTGGNIVEGEVAHINENRLTITFSTATSGAAYLS